MTRRTAKTFERGEAVEAFDGKWQPAVYQYRSGPRNHWVTFAGDGFDTRVPSRRIRKRSK